MKKTIFILCICFSLFALNLFSTGQSIAAEQANNEGNAKTATPATPAVKPTLEQAISMAVDEKKIDPASEKGFLGIPGAPQISPVMGFFWAIWVGWIFSTVGAFGGIMASVGHYSVFGLGDYAESFGKGTPINKSVTDSIRVSNQWLVGCSALITSFKQYSLGRLVLPLGIALGAGSLAGSILIPKLTMGKVDAKEYIGFFGIFVLMLGCYLFYETTPRAKAKKKLAAAAAKAFEEASKGHQESGVQTKVQIISISPAKVVFTFCGVEFSFATLMPVAGGFLIASVASFLGVGGGFLLVPLLTSISQLPMYLAAGTSAFAVLVGMITSIATFMFGGTPVYWPLIGVELVGIVIGSWIGPMTAKYLSDTWLKRIFIVLAFLVGINYVLRGFFNTNLW